MGFPGRQCRIRAWDIDYLEEVHGGNWAGSEIRSRIADNFFIDGEKWEGISRRLKKLAWRIASVKRTSQGIGEITIEQEGAARENSQAGMQFAQSITLWVRLENGEEVSRIWRGQGNSATFTFPAPIVAAEIRPDAHISSQNYRLRATYAVKPLKRGVAYWAHFVIGAIGGILQGIGIG
jgi:hypothetical protein